MEITSSWMLFASLGILMVSMPYFVHFVRSKNEKKSASLSIQEQSPSQDLHFDRIQRWRNHYMLGLDKVKNTLVYSRKGHYPSQCSINLNEVENVRLDSHYTEIKIGNNRLKKLDYLVLILQFKDPSRYSKSITIYEAGVDHYPTHETSIAKMWMFNIMGQLNPKSTNQQELQLEI